MIFNYCPLCHTEVVRDKFFNYFHCMKCYSYSCQFSPAHTYINLYLQKFNLQFEIDRQYFINFYFYLKDSNLKLLMSGEGPIDLDFSNKNNLVKQLQTLIAFQ